MSFHQLFNDITLQSQKSYAKSLVSNFRSPSQCQLFSMDCGLFVMFRRLNLLPCRMFVVLGIDYVCLNQIQIVTL